MITVPDAARRLRRDPETIRRWIRQGKLPSQKIGTQYFLEEGDLDAMEERSDMAALPPGWERTAGGEPMPDVVAWIRRAREGH